MKRLHTDGFKQTFSKIGNYYDSEQHEPLNELPLLTKEHSSRKQFMVSIPISQQPSSKRLHLHRCSPALQLSSACAFRIFSLQSSDFEDA
ncbi:hypothetical protein AAZX31_10G031800 [Glycine max]